MTAASPEAEQADLIRRMAQTLAADAAEHDIDLNDPVSRKAFLAGFAVSLGWITAAHETGKVDDSSFGTLEDLFGTAVLSLRSEGESQS